MFAFQFFDFFLGENKFSLATIDKNLHLRVCSVAVSCTYHLVECAIIRLYTGYSFI